MEIPKTENPSLEKITSRTKTTENQPKILKKKKQTSQKNSTFLSRILSPPQQRSAKIDENGRIYLEK